MPNARNSSSPTTAEENLFLDILNDAPLAAHRKPTRIYGSIFYCFLLAGYAIVGIGAPWIFEPLEAWISPLLCSCNVILLVITVERLLRRQKVSGSPSRVSGSLVLLGLLALLVLQFLVKKPNVLDEEYYEIHG